VCSSLLDHGRQPTTFLRRRWRAPSSISPAKPQQAAFVPLILPVQWCAPSHALSILSPSLSDMPAMRFALPCSGGHVHGHEAAALRSRSLPFPTVTTKPDQCKVTSS
jgi:hypothetical protein